MNKTDWLSLVIRNQDKLIRLIHNYHPVYRSKSQSDFKITAPAPEAACEVVRGIIKKDYKDRLDPAKTFALAIEKQDDRMITDILNETWFGVPESTSCWSIDGFDECIQLLENPIDE